MEGGGGILHTSAADEQKDRISKLPDEVIHEILACLRSSKKSAKLAVLSKRWNHLWRSYPVFDFYHREWPIAMEEENLKTFLTAAGTKFSNLQHAAAVRIELSEKCESSDLLDKLFGFVAKVTQEVFFTSCDRFIILPRGLFEDDRFRSLKVVKLQKVCFPSGSSVRFGASLQVLSLKYVDFAHDDNEGDGILNSMIQSASCLETLTLSFIYGIRRFHIQDCLRFLEILHVGYLSEEQLHGMVTPNNNSVKVLHIACAGKMTNEALNKFISKFSRLESLELISLPRTPRVKINVINHKFLRVIWMDMECLVRPAVIEIDAPWLSKLVLDIGGHNDRFPDMILINKAASEPVVQVLVRCRLFFEICWHELKRLFATLSLFQLTLEFVTAQVAKWKIASSTSDGDDESPIATIDHVKFPPDLLRLCDGVAFLNNLFRSCHPKMISFAEISDEVAAQQNVLLQTIWEYIDRSRTAAGKRWNNHQLKCAKMMERVINDDGIEEDIETDLVSFLDNPKRCWIVLYWR
ncbi:F-box/FBD/LRR-repeat protein At5g53840 [Linum grandiflorum]